MTLTKRDELAHADRSKSDIINEDFNSFHAFQRGYDAGSFQQEQDKRNYEFAVSECSKWRAMAQRLAEELRCWCETSRRSGFGDPCDVCVALKEFEKMRDT